MTFLSTTSTPGLDRGRSPSASCTRSGKDGLRSGYGCPSDTVSFTAVPPFDLGGSPRTLPKAADEAGGTAVKFYELRDNLQSGLFRVTNGPCSSSEIGTFDGAWLPGIRGRRGRAKSASGLT